MSISAPPMRTAPSSGKTKTEPELSACRSRCISTPWLRTATRVLIALYENDTPFTPNMVDLSNESERAALLKLWPIGKFPVLADDARDQTIPESTVIIDYLDRHYPGRTRFIPADVDRAWQMRLRDRLYDLY